MRPDERLQSPNGAVVIMQVSVHPGLVDTDLAR